MLPQWARNPALTNGRLLAVQFHDFRFEVRSNQIGCWQLASALSFVVNATLVAVKSTVPLQHGDTVVDARFRVMYGVLTLPLQLPSALSRQ